MAKSNSDQTKRTQTYAVNLYANVKACAHMQIPATSAKEAKELAIQLAKETGGLWSLAKIDRKSIKAGVVIATEDVNEPGCSPDDQVPKSRKT